MELKEHIVQVRLKPNCGLENTRAALVMRRIAPLCDTASCHPRTVKSDRGTIGYLCDHGLFIRFCSTAPEQVLLAIKNSFFVDCCVLVDNPDAIPPYDAPDDQPDGKERAGSDLSPSATQDVRRGSDEELIGLLARFEETQRALRAHAARLSHDQALNDILFSHAMAIDELRTAVERSRVEPFDSITPALHALVDDCGRRFGVAASLEVEMGHLALDRSVLAAMDEIIRRTLRLCVRDSIESPEERAAAGKPERGTIRLRVENDGSDIVCRIEHDGRPFDAKRVAAFASERGLLTRPVESYTDDEIGAFLLMPRFIHAGSERMSKALTTFGEIGGMLQNAGGQGEVRNTARGRMEIALHFPVPFTVMEVALLRTGSRQFALPAQQIKRFEAFSADRMEQAGSPHTRTRYVVEDGERHEMINARASDPLPRAEHPAFAVILEVRKETHVLAVDAVDGYERVSVSQLPALMQRRNAREAGCIGYAVLENGAPCAVVNVHRLQNGEREKEGGRA